jgi:pectate lyase
MLIRQMEKVLAALFVGILCGCGSASTPAAPKNLMSGGEEKYTAAVREFADNVLEYGRDRYGKASPLFADGLDLQTKQGAQVGEIVVCNVASQQYLMRYLCALSTLTGDARYKKAAADAVRYSLENLQSPGGLLAWGGHTIYDLRTDKPIGRVHELKSHYPYYELMWEVDPARTKKYIDAFWKAHIIRWDILDFNRHGLDKTAAEMADVDAWSQEYKGGPVPFVGEGLTFMNTGSDLFYSAAFLYHKTGEKKYLLWSKRLAKRYVESSNPKTGLGGQQFSEIKDDRGREQFGDESGITEVTFVNLYGTRYSIAAVSKMRIFQMLGPDDGAEFLKWAVDDLKAIAKWSYDEKDNRFWAVVSDGRKLTPDVIKRPGYFGRNIMVKKPADDAQFYAYALAYRLSRDESMLDMCRKMMKFRRPGGSAGVHGFIELYKATGDKKYLQTARAVADEYLKARFRNGYFTPGPAYRNSKFNQGMLLAMLRLDAVAKGQEEKVPVDVCGGEGFAHIGQVTYAAYAGMWTRRNQEFIRRWFAVGPFSNADDKGFDTVYGPEKFLGLDGAHDVMGGKKARWIKVVADEVGRVNLTGHFKPSRKVIAYATARIISPSDRTVTLCLRSNAGVKAWVNGQLVMNVHKHWFDSRAVVIHRGAPLQTCRADLKKGANTVLIKVEQYPALWRGGGLGFTAGIMRIPGEAAGLKFSPDFGRDDWWKYYQPIANAPTAAKTPPTIDGRLDDECWKNAPKLTGFIDRETGEDAAPQTTVRVAWDRQNLYLAIRCDDPKPSEIKANIKQHDGRVYQDDGMEIFLDTNFDRRTIYQLGFNALGTRRDINRTGQRDVSWNPDWRVKTSVGKDCWNAEIAIPFKELNAAAPKTGQSVWGVNFFRLYRGKEYSEWSQASQASSGNSYAPEKFGVLVFGKE